MDFANNLILVLKAKPSINTLWAAQLLKRNLRAAVKFTRKVVRIEDRHFESLRLNIQHLERGLLVPDWLLASIVDSLCLVFLLTELEHDEGVLVAEGVKVALKISLQNLELKSTACRLRAQ